MENKKDTENKIILQDKEQLEIYEIQSKLNDCCNENMNIPDEIYDDADDDTNPDTLKKNIKKEEKKELEDDLHFDLVLDNTEKEEDNNQNTLNKKDANKQNLIKNKSNINESNKQIKEDINKENELFGSNIKKNNCIELNEMNNSAILLKEKNESELVVDRAKISPNMMSCEESLEHFKADEDEIQQKYGESPYYYDNDEHDESIDNNEIIKNLSSNYPSYNRATQIDNVGLNLAPLNENGNESESESESESKGQIITQMETEESPSLIITENIDDNTIISSNLRSNGNAESESEGNTKKKEK